MTIRRACFAGSIVAALAVAALGLRWWFDPGPAVPSVPFVFDGQEGELRLLQGEASPGPSGSSCIEFRIGNRVPLRKCATGPIDEAARLFGYVVSGAERGEATDAKVVLLVNGSVSYVELNGERMIATSAPLGEEGLRAVYAEIPCRGTPCIVTVDVLDAERHGIRRYRVEDSEPLGTLLVDPAG